MLSACQISESEKDNNNQSPGANADIQGTWFDLEYINSLLDKNRKWSTREKYIFSNSEALFVREASENWVKTDKEQINEGYTANPERIIKVTYRFRYTVVGETTLEDGQIAKKMIVTVKSAEARFYSKKTLKIKDFLAESCYPAESTLKINAPYDIAKCNEVKLHQENKGLYQIIDGKLYFSQVDPDNKDNFNEDGFPKRMYDPNDKNITDFYHDPNYTYIKSMK